MNENLARMISNPRIASLYLRYKFSQKLLAPIKNTSDDASVYKRSLYELRMRMLEENKNSLDDILDTVLNVRPGHPPYEVWTMQLRDEIKQLAKLVKETEPQTVLEIGTANGGSFYIWSRYFDTVNNLVSLDLPGGRFGGGYDKRKTELFREFAPDKQMHFVRKDSHTKQTYAEIANIVDKEVDFLFIDGDHTYEGVKDDFEMYSQLVPEGGIVALHDIAHHPAEKEEVLRRKNEVDDIEDRHLNWSEDHADCEVDVFWDELRDSHDTTELISHPKQTWGGIGVVRL